MALMARNSGLVGDQNDLLAGFKDLRDPSENLAFLTKIVKRKKKEDKKAQERAKQREKNAEQTAAQVVEDNGQEAVEKMAELSERLGLDANALLDEYQDTQQVLFPVTTEALALDDSTCTDYMKGIDNALELLGTDRSFLQEENGRDGFSMLLVEGVRCGFVQSECLRLGSAKPNTIQMLFQLLSSSDDMEVAGAAFVTMSTLLRDATLPDLLLDPAYGLPAAGSPLYASLPNVPQVTWLPSIKMMYEALIANGYSESRSAGNGNGIKRRSLSKRQDLGDSVEKSSGSGMRIQALKLVLRTSTAVLRYCAKHSEHQHAVQDREYLARYLLATAHIGLDPCERLLLEDLDDAAVALLEAFEEVDWQRKLPQLAEGLAERAHSPCAHLRMLKRLPCSSPRGFALQQLSGCLLLERTIPCKGASASSLSRRGGTVDPVQVVATQPWFSDAKGLITSATRGGKGAAPAGGYHITQLELLLKVCHLLLWPHMVQYVEGASSYITPQFLDRWSGQGGFLEKLQKCIKGSLQPEDMAVKVMAQYLQLEFTAYQEAGSLD